MRRSVKIGFLGGLTLGTALMYFLDPSHGRRRRTVARDRATRTWRTTKEVATRTSDDLARSSHGLRCRVRSVLGLPRAADDLIAHRVRSRLAGIVANPTSIEVSAENGYVTLDGPIYGWEVDLLAEVGRIHGVSGIISRLEPQERGAAAAGLERRDPGQAPVAARWTSPTRLAIAAAGVGAFAHGLRRPGVAGLLWRTAGLTALTRSVTNVGMQRWTRIGAKRPLFRYRRSIEIGAPVENVFGLWSNIENFPIILSHVRRVQDLGNGRSLWAAEGLAGLMEWETAITRLIPGRTLSWRSEAGAQMPNQGLVQFESLPGGRTRVDLELSYAPPPGGIGSAVGALFGSDPTTALDADLARIKTLLEEGGTAGRGAGPMAESLPPFEADRPSHSFEH